MNRPTADQIRAAQREWAEAASHLGDMRREAGGDPAAIEAASRLERLSRECLGRLAREYCGGEEGLQVAVNFIGEPSDAVVIEGECGATVVSFSGETTIASYSESVPCVDPVCRPEPPREFAHHWKQMAAHADGVYQVMQGATVVALYSPVYFRSTKEVVSDLLELIRGGWEAEWGDDFVVWCNHRVMAVIHRLMDDDRRKVVFFDDPRNYPIGGSLVQPLPYWPTYDQWVESGCGALWKTDDPNYLAPYSEPTDPDED